MPSDYWKSSLGINNLFENMSHAQFNHRKLAYVTYVFTTVLFWKYVFVTLPMPVKVGIWASYGFVNFQLANGIYMLTNGVPLVWGMTH